MTLESRYRRALERIANHKIHGPVDEWSEAAAYGELQDIALEALEPGTMAARRKAEQEAEQLDRERAKQLRKESSAGKRHFYSDFGGDSGAIVCVLNEKCERPDQVKVKMIESVGGYRRFDGGHTFTTNIYNLYGSPADAAVKRRPWDEAKETP